MVCGLVVITAIGIIFGNAGFLLLGALGGLLSRLTYSYQRPASPNDYGASWSRFFLSPVVGALTGWSGFLLITLAHNLQILGSFFEAPWCAPTTVTFGVAFAFGFSERLFNDVFSQIENKLDPKENKATANASSALPGGGAPAAKPLQVVISLPITAAADRTFASDCIASGGVGAYQWKLSANAPPGVALNGQGRLTGSLTSAQSSLSIPVTVMDAKNSTAEGTYVVNSSN